MRIWLSSLVLSILSITGSAGDVVISLKDYDGSSLVNDANMTIGGVEDLSLFCPVVDIAIIRWKYSTWVDFYEISLSQNGIPVVAGYNIYGNNENFTIRGLPLNREIEFSIIAAKFLFGKSNPEFLYFTIKNQGEFCFSYQPTSTTRVGVTVVPEMNSINYMRQNIIIAFSVIIIVILIGCIILLILWFRCKHLFIKDKKRGSIDKSNDNYFKRPLPVEKDAFKNYYRQVAVNSGQALRVQFEILQIMSRSPVDSNILTCFEGMKNLDKNRYQNILPYDHNLVKVDRDTKYINASYVYPSNDFCNPTSPLTIFDEESDGNIVHGETNDFILTQAPIEETFGDFWLLIWERKVSLVLMLTEISPVEIGNFCKRYWPNQQEAFTFNSRECGTIRVELVEETAPLPDVSLTRHKITSSQSDAVQYVNHYYYKSWKDKHEPDLSSLHLFIETFCKDTTYEQGPKVIHCLAGVGRTGTLLACVYIRQMIREKSGYLDIFGLLLYLRQFRKSLVQNEEQYIFLHRYADHIICNEQ